jgi:hypothetical protein
LENIAGRRDVQGDGGLHELVDSTHAGVKRICMQALLPVLRAGLQGSVKSGARGGSAIVLGHAVLISTFNGVEECWLKAIDALNLT